MALAERRENYKIQSENLTISTNFGVNHAEWLARSISDRVKTITIHCGHLGTFDYANVFSTLYNIALASRSLEIFIDDDSPSGDCLYKLRISKKYWRTAPRIEEQYYMFVYDDLDGFHPRIMELRVIVMHSFDQVGFKCNPAFVSSATIVRTGNEAPMHITELIVDYGVMDSKEEAIKFGQAINKFPHLEALKAECYSKNQDEKLAALISVLDHNSKLRSLSVEATKPDALESLYDFLVKDTKLTSLNIRMATTPAMLKGTDIYFFDFLAHNRSLTSLSLLVGKIHEMKRLASLLKDHPSLTSLHIDYVNNDTDFEEIMSVISHNKTVRTANVRISSWTENVCKFLEESTHLTSVKFTWIHRKTLANDQTILEAFLTYPYLTSVDPPMLIVNEKLAENIANRNRFQEDMVVLLHNIVRNPSSFSQLPKEIWSVIMQQVIYPGVNQNFGQIMRDILTNNAIRHVVQYSNKDHI